MSSRNAPPDEWPMLQLYGQDAQHACAKIVGNATGVQALRDALEALLSRDREFVSVDIFASDGEGYAIRIVLQDIDETDADHYMSL